MKDLLRFYFSITLVKSLGIIAVLALGPRFSYGDQPLSVEQGEQETLAEALNAFDQVVKAETNESDAAFLRLYRNKLAELSLIDITEEDQDRLWKTNKERYIKLYSAGKAFRKKRNEVALKLYGRMQAYVLKLQKEEGLEEAASERKRLGRYDSRYDINMDNWLAVGNKYKNKPRWSEQPIDKCLTGDMAVHVEEIDGIQIKLISNLECDGKIHTNWFNCHYNINGSTLVIDSVSGSKKASFFVGRKFKQIVSIRHNEIIMEASVFTTSDFAAALGYNHHKYGDFDLKLQPKP